MPDHSRASVGAQNLSYNYLGHNLPSTSLSILIMLKEYINYSNTENDSEDMLVIGEMTNYLVKTDLPFFSNALDLQCFTGCHIDIAKLSVASHLAAFQQKWEKHRILIH